ncbi:MAG: CBS domain-containing protein [Candidatus Omnitrophota bacterium]
MINYYIDDTQTLKDAIGVIQGNCSRSVVVLGKGEKVVGVFTEGDVLRAILKGIEIYTPLKDFIRPVFHYLNRYDIGKAYKLAKEKGVTLIPIVNKDLKLMNVITLDDILSQSVFRRKRSGR